MKLNLKTTEQKWSNEDVVVRDVVEGSSEMTGDERTDLVEHPRNADGSRSPSISRRRLLPAWGARGAGAVKIGIRREMDVKHYK